MAWKQANLNSEGRQRRDRRYPRVSLRRYDESPFKHLFDSGSEQALLNATGVDHLEFGRLLEKFQPLFDSHTLDENTGRIVKKKRTGDGEWFRGRPRSIDATGCLGLVLMWFRTTGAINRVLPLVFGLTQTPMERWLKLGKRCLFVALDEHKPSLPTQNVVEQYIAAIASKYPHCQGVAFAADGCKLEVEKSGIDVIQNMFYNGWTHGHYISNVFVFAPDGKIVIAAINAPGTFHDSQLCDYGLVYNKLQLLYDEHGAKTVVDSAFNLGNGPFLIKSANVNPIGTPEQLLRNQEATSIRQLSEWGMKQFRSKFPRICRNTIPWEENGQRRIDLSLMIRLYNHQTSTIGMNQILSTFMPNVSPERRFYFSTNTVIDEYGDAQVALMMHDAD